MRSNSVFGMPESLSQQHYVTYSPMGAACEKAMLADREADVPPSQQPMLFAAPSADMLRPRSGSLSSEGGDLSDGSLSDSGSVRPETPAAVVQRYAAASRSTPRGQNHLG